MQAGTTFSGRSGLVLWALAVFGVGFLAVALSLIDLIGDGRAGAPGASGVSVAYFEFGREADALWLADPVRPSQRQKRLVAPHASDFGVVPRLAPDGHRFAYNALPKAARAPSADQPAELWLADVAKGSSPRRLAGEVDLLVQPLWSPDGQGIVFRRSKPEAQGAAAQYKLFGLSVASGEERLLVASDSASFPIAFGKDGSLLYVQLERDGSYLFAYDFATSRPAPVSRLSDGLTRDWTLSPDGERLAYLALAFTGGEVTSRGFVFELERAVNTPVGQDVDTFNPVWSATGALVLGHVGDAPGGTGAGVLSLEEGRVRTLPGPAVGFDVPISFEPASGGLLVRSFEGRSALAPGRSSLAFVSRDGSRKTITTQEVTFLGWTAP